MKTEKITTYINGNKEIFTKHQYIDMQFDNEDGYLFWNKKSSVKTFIESNLPDIFNWEEKGRIHELKNYMLQDSQLLVYRGNRCIKPLTIKELCPILKLSERFCKLFIKKLKDNSVIKEIEIDRIKYFAFNPIYGLKTKRISLTLFVLFQEELEKVLPKWVINKFIEQSTEIKPNIRIIK